jgi:hypothetical protein
MTPPSNTPGTNTNANANGYFGTAHSTRPSTMSSFGLDNTSAQTGSSDLFCMLGDINTFPELDGFDPKQDKFLESVIDPSFALPVPDSSGSSSTITQTQNDIASLLIPAASINAHIGSSEAPSAADTGSRISSSLSSLAQTLDILKTLSSAQSSRLTTFAGPDTSSDADAFTKGVLVENQQSIDAVGAILSSFSYEEDSFLLAVLYMIVLKILERYDAAAQVQPIDTESDWGTRFAKSMISHSTGQGHCRMLSGTHNSALRHDDNGRETVAAKLVLGELHRVQRLVNELSWEFKKHREGGDQVMRDGEKITLPLVTTSTLAQLETDVRKSLKALSTGIIDRLRRR